MPAHESLPVTVVLVVDLDGHHLSFTATGKATGARYHGAVPGGPYRPDESLEAHIRTAVAQCIGAVSADAGRFLQRAYPVAGAVADIPPDFRQSGECGDDLVG